MSGSLGLEGTAVAAMVFVSAAAVTVSIVTHSWWFVVVAALGWLALVLARRFLRRPQHPPPPPEQAPTPTRAVRRSRAPERSTPSHPRARPSPPPSPPSRPSPPPADPPPSTDFVPYEQREFDRPFSTAMEQRSRPDRLFAPSEYGESRVRYRPPVPTRDPIDDRIWNPDVTAMAKDEIQQRLAQETQEHDYLEARMAWMREFQRRNRGRRDRYTRTIGHDTDDATPRGTTISVDQIVLADPI